MDKKNIADIYPLSAMQEAFLVHSLGAGEKDQGLLQLRVRLDGQLQPELFAQAWEQVVERHPVLRTSVHWRQVDKPLQVVHHQVPLSLQRRDWRGATPQGVEEHLASLCREAREQGLDFANPPVMRLYLAQVDGQTWWLVWSCHHLLLDGWSSALVLRELLDIYEGLARGVPAALGRVQPYKNYINWLAKQDRRMAEAFWRRALAGEQVVSELAEPNPGRGGSAEIDFSLSAAETAQVVGLARANQLTLNSVVQGAWGLLLARITDRDEVLFGSSVSGRSLPLDGCQQMVGLFANTIPVRLPIDNEPRLVPWLAALQQQLINAQEYEHVPLGQIQQWSSQRKGRLFDTLVAFENYPGLDAANGQRQLRLGDFRGDLTGNFALILAVLPGAQLSFKLAYDKDNFTPEFVEKIAARLGATLVAMAAEPQQRHGALDVLGGESLALRPREAAPGADGQFSLSARDPIEGLLERAWGEVLGLDQVGVDVDFFSMGGHSLLATQLTERIAEYLGYNLPLSGLVQAPTIEKMAQLIRAKNGGINDWPVLVPIAKEGGKPPLFLVHGLPGVVFVYRTLAEHLAPDQPLYGLQAAPVAYRDIEPMAAQYVEAIEAVQATGPYYLGGYCFGGVVAFEMGRQLRAKGQEVALVIPIESMPPVGFKRNANYWKYQLARQSGVELFKRIGRKSKRYTKRVIRSVSPGEEGLGMEARDLLNLENYPAAYRPWVENHFRAIRDYQPEVYDGPMAVVRVDSHVARGDTTLGWGTWAGGNLEVVEIDGKHESLFDEPIVQDLGKALTACLEKAYQSSGS